MYLISLMKCYISKMKLAMSVKALISVTAVPTVTSCLTSSVPRDPM